MGVLIFLSCDWFCCSQLYLHIPLLFLYYLFFFFLCLFGQSICNGRGSCGCGGTCECRTPYFGQYCELCSGSSVCLETNCESNRQCANCILNIVAPQADRFMTAQYFSDSMNLPPGSNLTMDAVNDVIRVILPADTCSEMCPSGAFIINGSQRNEYFING